ncbi:MAG: C-terminal binding protein [Ignavibacteria bacterium]|nr:C-terminal binding protein [Ignavibacteria bacterium]
MKSQVVITDWGFPSLEPERSVFAGKDVEILEYQCKTEEEVARVVRDADVVMTQWAPVKALAIGAMRRCKGIVRYGIGLDNVDLRSAKEHGIPVRNVPDYCLDEVADHTMALMLALQRQVVRVDRLVRAGVWKITPPDSLPPLRKSVLGLVGFGRIGQLVAERARAFGMTIVAYDPLVDEKVFARNGAHGSTLEELFGTSDVISLHLPLTEETRHMINAQTLARMKSTALLVNTSRGGLIDSEALAAAVEKKTIAGAALDVFEQEPLPGDHALRQQENIVITSHIAWYSNQSIVELQRRAALAAAELLSVQ